MATGNDLRVARTGAAEVGIDPVHAGLLPGQTRELVRELRADRRWVAVVSDAMNDAPALMQARLGARFLEHPPIRMPQGRRDGRYPPAGTRSTPATRPQAVGYGARPTANWR